jgi:RHS repeat-associated protein
VTGDEASFSYQDGKLTKMVDYLGKNTWFEYQENDLLSRIYNHDESIFQDITYYSEEPHARKMKSVTNTAGNTETYTYDDNRPLTTITDSNGRMRMESFDREGFLLQSTDAEGNKTTQQYNYVNSKNYGEISRSIDGCGNITSYLYDSQGRVYKVTYPDDSIEMTTYDKYGNVIAMCSRTGAYTYYFYDEDGKNLLQEIRPVKKGLRYSDSEDQSLFAITTYTYDEEHAVKGLVKSKTLPLGDKDNYIIYSHNYKGQVVKETRFIDSVPYETTYEYNNRKLPVREIAPDGVTTEYTYNLTSEMVRKKILSSDHHQQSVSGVVYDEMGRKVLEISPIEYDTEHDQLDQGIYTGVGTMHTYDTSGNVLTTTDALGLKIQYTYDLYGNVIKEQMPDGSYTEFRYDSIDRLVAEYFYDVVEDNLTTKNLTYDQSGKNIKTTEVVSDGRSTKTTVTEIDFEGKLISEEVNGRKHQRTYLKGGILYQETDPSSRMTTYEYDGMDQIICKTESFESNSRAITVYTYDQGGNILSEEIYDNKVGEDPSSSRKTEYIYDKWGRAISQIFYSRGEPARYQQVSYDSKGRIKAQYKGLHKPLKINGETVTDSGDSEYSIIKFEYNYLDKKVKEIDALGRVTTYSYDAAGNIIASQTGEKFYAAVYDIKGNVLSETTSIAGEDAIEKTYEYDVLGRLTAGTYQGVQESYSYNGRSQLIRKERESTVSEFQYDFREALLSSNVYVNGVLQQQTINTYNSTGDLESVSDENGRIVQYQYDDGGRVILTRFSNGISEVREYNYAGLPKKISNQDSTGNEISSYEYSYFVDGSTYKINHAGGTTEYQYDGMNQLIAETHTSGSDVTSITYAYDDNGNQLEKIINSPSGSDGSKYQYDKLDQLTKEMKIKGETTTYTYDVYGNMVAKKSNSKTEEQQFDALNHLVYWSDGSSEADYCYDINGLRIAKIVDGQETKHIWAGNHIAVDIGPEGTIKYTYGSELVKSDYGIYLYNGHGDVVQLVNDGKVTSRYDYSAYGAPLDKISEYTGDANPYRYTAQYRDSETGYYYLRARYYDSELSRFINQDPIKDGSNWHVYGGDNPVANNDTTGLFFEKVWKKAKSAGRDFISASEKAVKTVGSVGNKVINKVKDFASTNVGRVVIGTTIIGLAAIATVATGGAAGGLAGAIAAGALKGAIVGAAMGAASGGAVGFVSHVMETGSLEGAGKATLDAATKGFMGGAITGAITGGIKGGISYHPKAAPSNIQKAVQSGKEGEFELKQLVGGESQKHFSTSDGARYVDQFAKGVAHESKVGYTSLTKSIRRQILKDTELIASGDIKGAVWHFFKSSVTGKGGASQPLTNFLIENGIKIMNHF